VLPFKNISDDAAQNYFSDGLAEEVRATLARNAGLLVMAQTSSSKFRDSDADAKGIAAQLGVAYLLDGSVRRSADSVRIAADLIDGSTGYSRWSELFERQMSDIFAVQEEIAGTVSRALASEVTPDATEPAEAGGTTSVAAYDAYLHGRSEYDLSANEASERAALAQFDSAIAIDPDYAAAHSARARSLTAIANQYTKPENLADMYSQAIAAAERAIQIAPGLADAHSTMGYAIFQGRLDAHAAREPFERSRKLGAGESTVMARYAQYSARVGRAAEAAQAMQRALLLDRLNPLIHRVAGSIAYAARDFSESIAPLRKALDMNPRLSRAHAAIGDALLMLGQPEAAMAEYTEEPSKDVRLTGLAIAGKRMGDDDDSALAAFTELVDAMGDQVLYQQAQIQSQWGAIELALDLLERARTVGDSGLIYARNDPFLDPLRSEPRFEQLLAGMGFD
jgi:TolB-like protein/Tfp pilus assembly protein PilF